VIAVVAAVVLAAAGAYGGYQLVLSRPVKVTTESGLSVEVPRAWEQKAENATGPALLVSTDTAQWRTDPKVEGVFMGVVSGSTLPTSSTPPSGCKAATADTGKTPAGVAMVTFRFGCSGPTVVERYLQLDGGVMLRVQVREENEKRRVDVLNSASYTP
jgi:hypothetical protein